MGDRIVLTISVIYLLPFALNALARWRYSVPISAAGIVGLIIWYVTARKDFFSFEGPAILLILITVASGTIVGLLCRLGYFGTLNMNMRWAGILLMVIGAVLGPVTILLLVLTG